ncbi:hypothetical protein AURDEDRAFT_160156 [Auricularia subglabra TFB-10046 SS5]|nr:hypothetical protein AURDEDRAFT_160156 [Auricularia subglabra TFB-10046 SS5]
MALLVLVAAQVALSLAGPTPLRAPRCVDSIAKFSASAANFDLITGALPPNATLPVSGTFGIQLRYCEPSVPVRSRQDTLQILVHGATANIDYWDTSYKPGTYSYAYYAAARGFATLNMARLGSGESDHPDPVSFVQTPLITAILQSIVEGARSGIIPGIPRYFEKIVYVGHSLGSILLNNLLLSHPNLIDAAVFTGYAHNLTGLADIVDVVRLGPARDIDPARFGDLLPDYTTTADATGRAAAFYGPQGTFEPSALAHDETHKDTTTTGEFLTLPVPVVAAPQFNGDVFVVNGANDLVFCVVPDCANTADEGQFFPAARSFEYAVVPQTGHMMNYHMSAPVTYATVNEWLTRHGY